MKKNKRRKNFELVRKSEKAKAEYSKIDFPYLSQIKRGLNSNRDKTLYETQKEMDYYFSLNTVEGQFQAWSINVTLQIAIEQNIKNFFIRDKNLALFFENTKINLKEKELIAIFEKLGLRNFNNRNIKNEFMKDVHWENIDDENYVSIFAIHSKHKKRSEMVHVSLLKGDDVEFPLNITVIDGIYASKFDLSDNYLNELNNEYQINGNLRSEDFKRIRYVLNLIIYQHAFPEYIKDGPPDDIIESNSNTLSISKQISDYLHDNRDVSPHLRRGHFRYLSSDFFKNKKGQTVFISPSFVKGNAKTVIEGGSW